MNIPDQLCHDCQKPKPLTGEFWYRDKSSKTKFARFRCRICSKRFMSREARAARAEQRKLAALDTYESEEFGAFGAKALAREVKKQSVVYSIYREI